VPERKRRRRLMIGSMAALHISEAELARDLHAVLEKVRQGSEIVVEQDHRPVAILRPARLKTPTMSEIIAAMEAGGACGIIDEDFARDVEEGIASRNEPWNPPSWD
jgi:antitoxin (DNA-binding transcriptional repressor) of toxin-antitoxin stability system